MDDLYILLKIVCSKRKSGSNTFVDGLRQKVLCKKLGNYKRGYIVRNSRVHLSDPLAR